MSMSRKERRQNGLLAWQLTIRTVKLWREGLDVRNMSKEELAAALAADMREEGLATGIDIERLFHLILEYLPQILELVIVIIGLFSILLALGLPFVF